ncbi:Lipopolysaccharide biosynthesis chain length determinant protein [hydrothermal vent metagenome]|uniref:Lipopolysaccharide biosynthesis chain length determinant protein n=1 Tax=hydrothermal vent metagenome TaxID=652676 RepID=A0A3B0WVQ9_9ZZZZ
MRDQIILIYSYLHGIWQYRWSALLIACVTAVVSWLGVYAMPNQYSAHAVMQIDTTSIMQPLLEGLAVESDVETGLNIMSRMLLSRKNLEDVIRQTDMDLNIDSAAEMDRLVESLAGSIVLKEVDKEKSRKKNSSNIYELSYAGDSARLAYQVVSKLLNTLIENTMDAARTDTAAAQKFLDRQIAEYENRLTTSEQALAVFKRENVGFMPDEKGGYYAKLQREESELESLTSELRLAKRRHSAMMKQLDGEAPLLDNNSYGGSKLLKIRRYREELEELLVKYQEQHPDVRALRATIAEAIAEDTETDVDEFTDSGGGDSVEFNPVYQELKAEIGRSSISIETLKIKLSEQASRVEKLKKAVDVLPGVEAKLVKLNRDYDITRERYLSLVARRESARLAQEVGLSGSNVKFRIIDSPREPTKPSGPPRLLFLAAAFLLAIGAGLGWGFLRYIFQPTYIESSQISNTIGLPVLGSVGLYMTDEHSRQRKKQLLYFLLVFFLLVFTFIVVAVFNESGSFLVSELILKGST